MIGIARGYTLIYLFWSTYRYYLDKRSGSMEINIVGEDRDCQGITVEVTRHIRVDSLYKISPTEGFLGIEAGTVRVVFIGSLPSLLDYDEDMSNGADMFAESMIDLCGEDAMELSERFRTQPWVVYQYSKLPQDRHVLPLEEFVIHTTQY